MPADVPGCKIIKTRLVPRHKGHFSKGEVSGLDETVEFEVTVGNGHSIKEVKSCYALSQVHKAILRFCYPSTA